jgi:hypothetical protein
MRKKRKGGEKMRSRWLIIGLSFMIGLLGLSQIWAYDNTGTHQAISERAVLPQNSILDSFLSVELARDIVDPDLVSTPWILQFKEFPNGINQTVNNKRVREWIEDGSEFEDEPFVRVQNHFHNPLRPWSQAGLSTGGMSSVLWAQAPDQNEGVGGGKHSWKDARDSYYRALTGRTRTEREEAWAETFQTLGHLMHLLQDATVPAHVRDDAHPPFETLGFLGLGPDWYEDWVEQTRKGNPTLFQTLLSEAAVRPPNSIFTATGDPQAPVPIARLFDTDAFTGLNPDVLSAAALGITEYTNGNFLSRDTIFKDFTLPRQPDPNTGFFEAEGPKFRRYFPKVGEGESIDHFVAEGMLYTSLEAEVGTPPAGGWMLTARVLQNYAQKLFSRAIGYSAALLNYFFRGRMELGLFGATGQGENFLKELNIDGRNVTPNEETGTGQMVAIIPFQQGNEIVYQVSKPLTVTLTRDFQPLTFDYSDNPIQGRLCTDSGAVPCDIHLIYRGPLGQENDAVMVVRSQVGFD